MLCTYMKCTSCRVREYNEEDDQEVDEDNEEEDKNSRSQKQEGTNTTAVQSVPFCLSIPGEIISAGRSAQEDFDLGV